MITQFKIFENSETETTFILNDLIAYYNGDNSKIKRFITKLLYPGTVVKINCRFWDSEENNYLIHNQTRNGVVKRIISCYPHENDIYLPLMLINDDQIYYINDKSTITIYGDIPTRYKNIINNLNIIHQTKKFNI